MNRLAVVLGGALVVAGIVALVLLGESRSQRETNAQLLARVEGLEAARAASAGTPSGSPTGLPMATAGEAATSMAASDLPSAGASPVADRPPDSLAAALRQSMDTESGREFTRTMLASALAQQYPDLASELGLDAEQADRLIQMLAQQRTETGMERAAMLGAAEEPATRGERARRLAATEQAHEAQLSELLGAAYPKWKEYQRNTAVRQRQQTERTQLATLRNAVSAGRQMDDAQFEAVRAAINEEERRIQEESRGFSASQRLQRLPEEQRRLADAASRYLDAQQLQGYQRHLQQQADMMRMTLGVLGAIGGDAPPSGPPAD